jgi:hypothetical protein
MNVDSAMLRCQIKWLKKTDPKEPYASSLVSHFVRAIDAWSVLGCVGFQGKRGPIWKLE